MRICFVAPGHRTVEVLHGDTRNTGGAEAQVAYLATAFAGLGHQVELIYGDGTAQSAPCRVANVRLVDKYPAWNHPASLPAFWTALKKSNADLIYTRVPGDFVWVLGLYAKTHAGTSFLYALANDRNCNPWRYYRYRKWFHGPLYALGLGLADVVAVQHTAQVELVRSYTRAPMIRIPNLIRSASERPRDFEQTHIDAIWIAQVRPQKQLYLFLDVAAALPHLRFAVVGWFAPLFRPGERKNLENRMHNLKNVRFLGPQLSHQVMQLLEHSRVLVNTSNAEGFPNTMLEAWSVGVPVVSLQIDPGGVIQREAMGLVSGTLSRMISDVEKLATTPSLNRKMGQAGLDYVCKTHRLDSVCEAFGQIVPGIQQGESAEKVGAALCD